MAALLKQLNPAISQYRDRRFQGTQEGFEEALRTSACIYVGNLSFYTTEDQIYEVFSKVGDIKRIIMGLDKKQKTPCGFCFVVYYTREDAEDCVKYLSGTSLDDRPIRADFDWGFVEGRQYGRGKSGGQVRDEYRMNWDDGRGGWSAAMRDELKRRADMVAVLGDGLGAGGFGAGPAAGPAAGGEPGPKRFRGEDSDEER